MQIDGDKSTDTTATGEGEGEVSFADHFKEFARGSSSSDHDAGDKGAEASGATDEGKDTTGVSDKDTSKGTEPGKDQKSDAKPDIWANLSPEQRQELERINAENARLADENKKHRGRQSTVDRKLAQIERLQAGQPSSGKDNGDKKASPFEKPEWKTFKTEYPEIAPAVEAIFGDVLARQEEVSGVVTDISVRDLETAIDTNEATVAEKHPDWKEVCEKDPELRPWLESQPRHVQEAAVRNGDAVIDPAEFIDVLDRFKAFKAAKGQPAKPSGQKKDPDPKNPTAGRRERQLQSTTQVRTPGPAQGAAVPDDYRAAFKHYAKTMAPRTAAGG